MLVLFMGPAEEIPLFRTDPDGMWDRMLRENPVAAERVGGAENRTKVRSTGNVSAFFRRSSGPGWGLAGDAGHFKDPVIGQGMRDAMRFGRLLGEAVAPAIHDPAALDVALLGAERRRDKECLASYHWGNRESRIAPVTPLFEEALRDFTRAGETDLMDMFDRGRAPHRVLNPARGLRCAMRAAIKPSTDRRALLAEMREELRIDAGIWREELTTPFRSTRVTPSERPDFGVPGAPAAPGPGVVRIAGDAAVPEPESAAV